MFPWHENVMSDSYPIYPHRKYTILVMTTEMMTLKAKRLRLDSRQSYQRTPEDTEINFWAIKLKERRRKPLG